MWTPSSSRPPPSQRTLSASSTSVHPGGSMLQRGRDDRPLRAAAAAAPPAPSGTGAGGGGAGGGLACRSGALGRAGPGGGPPPQDPPSTRGPGLEQAARAALARRRAATARRCAPALPPARSCKAPGRGGGEGSAAAGARWPRPPGGCTPGPPDRGRPPRPLLKGGGPTRPSSLARSSQGSQGLATPAAISSHPCIPRPRLA
jgi:hypothetical protein